MSKDFWFPLYPAKWEADTLHLTAEQDGIYGRLIRHYMKTREPLPDNDIALARIAGVSDIKWLDAARILRAYFTHADGMLFHDFCDQMLEIQDKKRKIRSSSAEKAAKIRWKKEKQLQLDICAPHAPRIATAMRPDATDTDTDRKRKKKINKKENIFSEKFMEFWEIYPRHRRGNKTGAWNAWRKAVDENRATEEEILEAGKSYARSDQGQSEFAKGAAAWLNDDRWNWELAKKVPKFNQADWPVWKKELAKIIGAPAVASWFSEVEINGASIAVSKKFHADYIRNHYLVDIEKAFGKPYQVVVKEALHG